MKWHSTAIAPGFFTRACNYVDDFNTELLSRLPLAEAVVVTLSHIAQPSCLEDSYSRFRGRAYEKALSFIVLVHLIRDALIEHDGSGETND